MDDKVSEIRRARWRTIIMSQKESGLTITAWCKQNGIRMRQFHYWQKILRDADLLKMSEHPSSASLIEPIVKSGDSVPAETSQVFAELPVPVLTECSALPENKEQLCGFLNHDSGIRITCRDIDIQIADTFNERTLAKVLQVIRNA